MKEQIIKFTDFIKPQFPNKTKIKFNMNAGNRNKPALDNLLHNEKEWFEMNSWRDTKALGNNQDKAEYLIALAQYYPYGSEYYMFGGLYKIKVIPEIDKGLGYELTLMNEYSEYIKRLIIKIQKPIGRDVYSRWYETIDEQLSPEVYEVSANIKMGNFLGYQNTSLNHKDMQLIVNNEEPIWKNALSNVKGVYVVTDTETGKLYIGSAYGDAQGIWQRWSSYANFKNLTGGNKEFGLIVKERGKDYIINNFRYSILEIFDTKTKDNEIIERENYWKMVFDSKKHGMNHN